MSMSEAQREFIAYAIIEVTRPRYCVLPESVREKLAATRSMILNNIESAENAHQPQA